MIHIAAIESLAAQLHDVNSAVSDDQIIAKITSTLPLNGKRNYKAFMSAWNSSDDTIKTIPLLASRLQVEKNLLKLADLTMNHWNLEPFLSTKRKGKMHFLSQRETLIEMKIARSPSASIAPNSIEDQTILKQTVG